MGNTILLADKSITIQKIVELTFSDENYQIKCVNDGQSALDAISALRPSIILADINLPVKSGYEICQILRNDPAYASMSTVPVILLAGIYETMDEERARQVEQKVKDVGANDLLSKPFDPQLLTSKVKELMGSSLPAPAAEVAAADSFLSEPPSEGIFSEMPSASVPSIEAPPDLFAAPAPPPPDDAERTMMLPSAFSFTGNMFAETPPVAEDVPAPDFDMEQSTVKVEAVTPASEPVFEMSELESAPQPQIEEPVEPSMEEEGPAPEGDAFAGREEMEFAMDTQPGVVIAPPVTDEMEESPAITAPFVAEAPFPSPFEAEPEPEIAAAASASDFVAAGDEPFGDVFGSDEVTAPQQWSVPASSSEEDSPFGLPEPPPAPEPEPEPEPLQTFAPAEAEAQQEERATSSMESIPIAESWAMSAPETPVMQDAIPEVASAEDDSQKVLDEIMAAPDLKPEFGEDTWSQARKVAGGRVEELFEEPAQAEEAEELQPDLTETPLAEPIVETTKQEDHTPVVAGGAVEITDELIDRIAARVVAKLSERIVSEIVWQVVPDLAEKMIRRELEKLNAGD